MPAGFLEKSKKPRRPRCDSCDKFEKQIFKNDIFYIQIFNYK